MKKFIKKFNNYIEKIGKINFVLVIAFVLFLISVGIYQTYSLLTSSQGISYSSNTKTYKFIIGDNKENEITIGADDSKYIDITIMNNKEIDLLYSLYYNMDTPSENIIIGYLDNTSNLPNGIINKNSKSVVSIKIMNNTSVNQKITIGISSGTTSGGELKTDGTKITEKISNLDKGNVNIPNLDNNLIPVYYDNQEKIWRKADESNTNPLYKWYSYSNEDKMWANAIMVNKNTQSNYLNSKIGTRINQSDIIAFFVWIPRYKYRVWNITRQAVEEYDYNYDAYTTGIEIKFEKGTETTGNVTCQYNLKKDNEELSDICNYKGNIVSKDNNKLDDIWYTHPAFTLNSKELTGFWIGKFETTGLIDEPTILPDKLSIKNINISNQFTISKKFNNYETMGNNNAHMLKNIEWGAVSYLTHSIYGMCDGIICNEVYINNSKTGYTGRSAGTIAQNATPTESGSYSYDGYQLAGETKQSNQQLNKVASTTGNITGVYDMVGGTSEYVMANITNTEGNFNPSKSGTSWNNSKYLSEKYYDTYAYGETKDDQKAFDRSRLGDATAEVTSITEIEVSAWESRLKIAGIEASFPNKDSSWFTRGGEASDKKAGLFNYNSANGDKSDKYGFRIALS